MKVEELIRKLSGYADRGKGDWEAAVLTKEPTVAGGNKEIVTGCYPGFDQTKGFLLLATEHPLLHKELSRDTARSVIRIPGRACSSDSLCCPSCSRKISRNDQYCRRCGQKLDQENVLEVPI